MPKPASPVSPTLPVVPQQPVAPVVPVVDTNPQPVQRTDPQQSEPTPFQKFAADRLRTSAAKTEEPAVPIVPATVPASQQTPGQQEPQNIFSTMASLFTKPQAAPAQQPVQTPAQNDPLSEFSDVIAALGPPPDARATTAEQFDYVKRSREAIAREATKRLAEVSARPSVDPELVKERDRFKSEYEKVSAERDEIRRKLAVNDLREDPTFIETFETPITKLQSEIVQMIKVVARDNPEDLRRQVQQALALADDGQFRAAVNGIAESIGSFDGVDLRRMMFDLRNKAQERSRAMEDFEKTNQRIGDIRERRNKAATVEFTQRHLPLAMQRLVESDPLQQALQGPQMREVLAPFKTDIQQGESIIDRIMEGFINSTGPVTPAVTEVVAMAKARLTERIVLEKAMMDMAELQREYDRLSESYRVLTGKPPSRFGPDNSGVRSPSDMVPQQQSVDPWKRKVDESPLVRFATGAK